MQKREKRRLTEKWKEKLCFGLNQNSICESWKDKNARISDFGFEARENDQRDSKKNQKKKMKKKVSDWNANSEQGVSIYVWLDCKLSNEKKAEKLGQNQI